MRFRDLECFNIALLGKHGWRMMTNPESLCSRVLKGCYFPNSDFMSASVPRNASTTWKGIMAGRKALEAGLLCRICDGTSVKIWTGRWLPGKLSLQPLVQIGSANLYTVSDLIDTDNWSWKVDLIRSNFTPLDADAILNLPLRQGGGDDFWAWAHERSGSYIVKSVYHALMTRNEQLALGEGTITETSENDKQLWTRLWKLKVLPKVRVFWWRVLRGILPVESTLKYWHVATSARCKICKRVQTKTWCTLSSSVPMLKASGQKLGNGSMSNCHSYIRVHGARILCVIRLQ